MHLKRHPQLYLKKIERKDKVPGIVLEDLRQILPWECLATILDYWQVGQADLSHN